MTSFSERSLIIREVSYHSIQPRREMTKWSAVNGSGLRPNVPIGKIVEGSIG